MGTVILKTCGIAQASKSQPCTHTRCSEAAVVNDTPRNAPQKTAWFAAQTVPFPVTVIISFRSQQVKRKQSLHSVCGARARVRRDGLGTQGVPARPPRAAAPAAPGGLREDSGDLQTLAGVSSRGLHQPPPPRRPAGKGGRWILHTGLRAEASKEKARTREANRDVHPGERRWRYRFQPHQANKCLDEEQQHSGGGSWSLLLPGWKHFTVTH